MPEALSVNDVCVAYRTGFLRAPFRALDAVRFAVAAGEILGVLGPNGSGKTSLLRVLAGLLRPTAGTASVLGLDPTDRRLIAKVGYLPEGPLPFPGLSGPEFLEYMAALTRLPAGETRVRAAGLLDRLDLRHAGRRPVKHYSTGMRQRLALAAALLHEPDVLLLDEPTAGLDPAGSLLVIELLREQAARGCAVLMASHHLQEVEQLCDRVCVLGDGRVVRQGTLDELLGTGETALIVRGLDAAGIPAVRAAIAAAGGDLLRAEPRREHLFALFRRAGAEERG